MPDTDLSVGAESTCGRCGSPRPGGYDWAMGKVRTGHVGLCEGCFTRRVDLMTRVISNQPAPLPAMLVMAAGISPEREVEFAQGQEPTEVEVSAAMEVLTEGGR